MAGTVDETDMKERFTIAYDGPGVQDGTMEVGELAPALMAVGRVCNEANHVLNGDRAQVAVRVRATRPGSFGVELEVARSLSRVVEFFNSKEVVAVATLIGLVGGGGLLEFLKWLRARKVTAVEKQSDGNVRIDVGDGSMVVNDSVFNLYMSYPVRREVENIMRPLERDDIETFAVSASTDQAPILLVHKKELNAFRAPPPAEEPLAPEPSTEQDFVAIYVIMSPHFHEGNKWKLYDGSHVTPFAILDDDFLAKVAEHRIRFGKDDRIKARVRLRQWRSATTGTLKTEWEVLKVLEIIPAPVIGQQIHLDAVNDSFAGEKRFDEKKKSD